MWGSREERIGRRRLRALVTNLPPDSVTALRIVREGGSRMSKPARRLASPGELAALGVPVGIHHG